MSLMVVGRYVCARFSEAENEEPLSDHTVIDLAASWQLGPGWELFAGVENALDESYPIRYGAAGLLYGAPRLYHMGVRFRSAR